MSRKVDPHAIELGKLIRQRRLELGYSQSQLANMLGYKNCTAISFLESELRGLSNKNRMKTLANVLSIPIEILGQYYLHKQHQNLKESKSELGNIIRDRRIELGLSQGALGRKIGQTGQAVSAIEHGKWTLSSKKGEELRKRIFEVLEILEPY